MAALGPLVGRVAGVEKRPIRFEQADRTFCVYLAEDERAIREHAEISGFPANRIIQISKVIDPSTARDASGGAA